jgi:hypothetical protein
MLSWCLRHVIMPDDFYYNCYCVSPVIPYSAQGFSQSLLDAVGIAYTVLSCTSWYTALRLHHRISSCVQEMQATTRV